MKPTKIAIIGTAHPHSHAYQQTLAAMDEVLVTGIVEDGGPIADEMAQSSRFQTMDALLGQADFSHAYVFVSNDRAAEVCEQLVDGSKHVFCEKPGCKTADEMRRLRARVRQKGVTFGVGYQWRIHPITRYVKDLVDGGHLGTIHSIEARMVTTDVEARDPNHPLFRREVSGGGIVHWLGCHHIDLLRFLTSQEVEEVGAFVNTVASHAIDVEDLASFTLRFRDGVLATLHQGYLIPSAVDNAFMNSSYDAFLAVRGSLGWVRWDQMSNVVEAYSAAPEWAGAPYRKTEFGLSQKPGYGWAGYEMVRRLIAAANGEGPVPADETDALRALEIIEAVYRSAESKQVKRIRS